MKPEPFGGLFGDAPITRVLNALAGGSISFTQSDLVEWTGLSATEVSDALERLQVIGMVLAKGDRYTINKTCNRYIALDILFYSLVDDMCSSNLMRRALLNHYNELRHSRSENAKIKIELYTQEGIRLQGEGDTLREAIADILSDLDLLREEYLESGDARLSRKTLELKREFVGLIEGGSSDGARS